MLFSSEAHLCHGEKDKHRVGLDLLISQVNTIATSLNNQSLFLHRTIFWCSQMTLKWNRSLNKKSSVSGCVCWFCNLMMSRPLSTLVHSITAIISSHHVFFRFCGSGLQTGHKKDKLFVLHSVWRLAGKVEWPKRVLNGWGLELSEGSSLQSLVPRWHISKKCLSTLGGLLTVWVRRSGGGGGPPRWAAPKRDSSECHERQHYMKKLTGIFYLVAKKRQFSGFFHLEIWSLVITWEIIWHSRRNGWQISLGFQNWTTTRSSLSVGWSPKIFKLQFPLCIIVIIQ